MRACATKDTRRVAIPMCVCSWTAVARLEPAKMEARAWRATASARQASPEPTARVSPSSSTLESLCKDIYFYGNTFFPDALWSDNNVDCHEHGSCVIRNDGEPFCVCRHTRWTHSQESLPYGDCAVETCADDSTVCHNGGSCMYVSTYLNSTFMRFNCVVFF